MKKMQRVPIALALALACAWIALSTAALAQAVQRAAPMASEVTVDKAALTISTIMKDPDFPHSLPYIQQSKAVLVFPNILKGGFMFLGARGGSGVMVSHKGPNDWSEPVFITIGGLSFGLQMGAQVAELVVIVMTDRGLEALLDGSFTFGGDISVSALIKGAGIGVGLDVTSGADFYAINRSKGLYLGGVLEGSKITISRKMNDAFYGTATTVEGIVGGGLYTNPRSNVLLDVLP